jgi:hypothetical protein
MTPATTHLHPFDVRRGDWEAELAFNNTDGGARRRGGSRPIAMGIHFRGASSVAQVPASQAVAELSVDFVHAIRRLMLQDPEPAQLQRRSTLMRAVFPASRAVYRPATPTSRVVINGKTGASTQHAAVQQGMATTTEARMVPGSPGARGAQYLVRTARKRL